MRQVVNSHLLRLNNTATIADVMGQNSKCSGSFGDLQERGMTQICITTTTKQMHHITQWLGTANAAMCNVLSQQAQIGTQQSDADS